MSARGKPLEPSPRPWRVERTDAKGWKGISILDANGLSIAYMVMQPHTDNEMVNARLIVDAVNAAAPFEYCPPIETVCRHGKTLGPCPICGETYNAEQRAARRDSR